MIKERTEECKANRVIHSALADVDPAPSDHKGTFADVDPREGGGAARFAPAAPSENENKKSDMGVAALDPREGGGGSRLRFSVERGGVLDGVLGGLPINFNNRTSFTAPPSEEVREEETNGMQAMVKKMAEQIVEQDTLQKNSVCELSFLRSTVTEAINKCVSALASGTGDHDNKSREVLLMLDGLLKSIQTNAKETY